MILAMRSHFYNPSPTPVGALEKKNRRVIVGDDACDVPHTGDSVDALFDPHHPRYVAAWQKAVDQLVQYDVPFEINTGAISRGYRTQPYPAEEMIAYIKARGGRFVLSSDAHSADSIAYGFGEYEVLVNGE